MVKDKKTCKNIKNSNKCNSAERYNTVNTEDRDIDNAIYTINRLIKDGKIK